MTPRSWIRKLFARPPRTVRKAPARCRPAADGLGGEVPPREGVCEPLTRSLTKAKDSVA